MKRREASTGFAGGGAVIVAACATPTPEIAQAAVTASMATLHDPKGAMPDGLICTAIWSLIITYHPLQTVEMRLPVPLVSIRTGLPFLVPVLIVEIVYDIGVYDPLDATSNPAGKRLFVQNVS